MYTARYIHAPQHTHTRTHTRTHTHTHQGARTLLATASDDKSASVFDVSAITVIVFITIPFFFSHDFPVFFNVCKMQVQLNVAAARGRSREEKDFPKKII
jgi:hypothetical protein